jgi:hypothetical protein
LLAGARGQLHGLGRVDLGVEAGDVDRVGELG